MIFGAGSIIPLKIGELPGFQSRSTSDPWPVVAVIQLVDHWESCFFMFFPLTESGNSCGKSHHKPSPNFTIYIYIHIYILIYVHTSSKTGGLLQALPHVLFPLCVVVGLLGGSTEDFGRVRHASGPSGWLSGCGLFFPQKWMNGTYMGHRCHFLNGHWVNLG